MRVRTLQPIAIAGALLVWAALVVQLAVLIRGTESRGGTVLLAVWRFFGFFTVLTNNIMVESFSCSHKGREHRRARQAAGSAICRHSHCNGGDHVFDGAP